MVWSTRICMRESSDLSSLSSLICLSYAKVSTFLKMRLWTTINTRTGTQNLRHEITRSAVIRFGSSVVDSILISTRNPIPRTLLRKKTQFCFRIDLISLAKLGWWSLAKALCRMQMREKNASWIRAKVVAWRKNVVSGNSTSMGNVTRMKVIVATYPVLRLHLVYFSSIAPNIYRIASDS